ncbi:MAG TPA: BlaI/MecI/CopY family transcriptional regulator [Bryobacteraceae bacterium]|nr:BlaI/MecI/CopY family transcriptional regulator [Bryobacteraceae bacterium]
MSLPRLSPLELQIMDALWKQGKLAIREIQEAFPEPGRPAYSTIQTTVYRLEEKGAIQRIRKIGNAHIFQAALDRQEVRGRLIDELLGLFGGDAQPVMAHLVQTGKLTLADVRQAERMAEELSRKTPRK